MKKVILVLMILLLFLVSSCFNPTTSKAHISFEKDYSGRNLIKTDETFRMEFFVENPFEQSFIGYLNYKYEQPCLNAIGGSQNESIEVKPDDKKGIIKEFTYNSNKFYSYNNLNIECLDVPLKITIFLYDKSGLFKDSKEIIINIIE